MSKPKLNEALRVVALPGDGVGPEISVSALQVLRVACERAGRALEISEHLIGGAALDKGEPPLPEATRRACENAHGVLLGAVGGPKWDSFPASRRPEKGLLALRKALGVYANLRPVKAVPVLASASPLKDKIIEGTDMVVVRELIGGIYFGEPRELDEANGRAINTMVYTTEEIQRVARTAFELARQRTGRVTSVDKANVLEVSRLWRKVVQEMRDADYTDIELSHQYVDSCAMDFIRKPSSFDVVLTPNLFGDILTDEAAVLAGSIGMLPSASLGDGPGLYEPIHGSAPDIAGQGIANPLGTIASVAFMLRASLGLVEQGDAVEAAIDQVLNEGARTKDLGGNASTKEMGDRVCRALEQQ